MFGPINWKLFVPAFRKFFRIDGRRRKKEEEGGVVRQWDGGPPVSADSEGAAREYEYRNGPTETGVWVTAFGKEDRQVSDIFYFKIWKWDTELTDLSSVLYPSKKIMDMYIEK